MTRIVADFHIHSKYARATSERCEPEGLAEGAKIKGINVIATGDFTHPTYFNELKYKLKDEDKGLYNYSGIKFILSVEIALFYRVKDTSKKIHIVILAPSLEIASQINEMLSKYGNLSADGRPMMKLSPVVLIDELMQISKDIFVIPAHCLLPGTLIHNGYNLKNIEEVQEGDKVYTHLGRLRTVVETIKRPFNGDVYTIIPWYFSLGVTTTGKHPIYAIKTVKNCSWTKNLVCKPTVSHLRICHQHFYKKYLPQWMLAHTVEKGDVLVYPRFNEKTENKEEINLIDIIPSLKNEFKVSINRDFCRLAGYYLAEGHSQGMSGIGFTFNVNERRYIKDIKNIILNLFGKEGKKGKNSGEVYFFSKNLMLLFENLFYNDVSLPKRSFNKSMPNWMLSLPIEKQVEIFRGWWRGDKGSTSSKALANQMKILCLRLGIIPSIRVDTKEDQ